MPHAAPDNSTGYRLIYPLTAITILLVLCIPVSLLYTFSKNTHHQEQYSLQSANDFTRTLSAFRTFYSRTIASRLRGQGDFQVTHDYLDKAHAIPLPATFAKDFGHFINEQSNIQVNLYSDLPFPWRQNGHQEERELTTFEKDALAKLKINPGQPVWQFNTHQGEKTLNYAVADVLTESCIGCHNSYPGTPKTDWEVGDVRGVLTVSMPASSGSTQSWLRDFGIIALLLAMTAGLLMFVFNTLRKSIQREQSARERLEIGANKNKAVFDSVHDAIIVIDDHGVIRETNQSVYQILGYTPDELVGNNVNMIVNDRQAPKHDHYLANFRNKSDSPLLGTIREEQAKRKDGSIIPVELTINATDAGGERLVTGVIRDISARKQAEGELSVAHRKALESVKAKSQFMANMSHEIRTPMNGISGTAQLLDTTTLDEQQSSYVKILQKSSQSLMRIINDILDFSKIESGHYTLEKEWFSLLETVEDNIDLMAEVAFTKNIDLSLVVTSVIPQYVYGDQGRIGQVLNNLIHNAIKFTSEGGVLVNVKTEQIAAKNAPAPTEQSRTQHEQQQLIIEISDSGSGIAPSQIDKLFEPFTQADGTDTRQHGGTGLGLAICKEFTELMGGELSVESALEKGATFRVSVPLKTRGTPYFPQATPGFAVVMLVNTTMQSFHSRLAKSYADELALAGITQVDIVHDEDSMRQIVQTLNKRIEANTHQPANPQAVIVVDIDALLRNADPEFSQSDHVQGLVSRCQATSKIPLVLYGMPKLISELGMTAAKSFNNVILVPKPIKPSIVLNALTQLQVFAPMNGAASSSQAKTADKSVSPAASGSETYLSKRILIVEDNDINYTVVAHMLKKSGYRHYERAIHGEEALEALQNQRFDLVLMDCQMPVMDGFTTTEIFRRQEQAMYHQHDNTTQHGAHSTPQRHTPIVALTANVLKVDQDRCLTAGMDDYLAKPIEIARLQACLKKWLAPDSNKPDDIADHTE